MIIPTLDQHTKRGDMFFYYKAVGKISAKSKEEAGDLLYELLRGKTLVDVIHVTEEAEEFDTWKRRIETDTNEGVK